MTEVEMHSAIAATDPLAESTNTPNALKRRRSSDEGDEARNEDTEQKRQRINGDGNPVPTETAHANNETSTQEAPPTDPMKDPAHDTPQTTAETSTPQPAPPSKPTRRKNSTTDEKQRSKRLFGALLGNLARSTESKQASRRVEIEARRRSEIRKQDEETEAQEARKREERQAWRLRRQGKVEEENMKVRHQNELERARFLVTETEPRIYWRPWELREEAEVRVEEQVRECEGRVERERREFYRRSQGEGGAASDVGENDLADAPPVQESDRNDEKEGKGYEAGKTNTNDAYIEEPAATTPREADGEQNMNAPALNEDLPTTNGNHTIPGSPIAQDSSEDRTTREQEPDMEVEHDGGGEGEEDTVIY